MVETNRLPSILLKLFMILSAAWQSLKTVPDWCQEIHIGKCPEFHRNLPHLTWIVLYVFSARNQPHASPYCQQVRGDFQRLTVTIFTGSKISSLMRAMEQNILIHIFRKFRSHSTNTSSHLYLGHVQFYWDHVLMCKLLKYFTCPPFTLFGDISALEHGTLR